MSRRTHCPNVLAAQALRDDVDSGGVGEHVRPARAVVHQGLDAAKRGGVDRRLPRVPVHPGKQVEQAAKTVRLQEPSKSSLSS